MDLYHYFCACDLDWKLECGADCETCEYLKVGNLETGAITYPNRKSEQEEHNDE